VGIFKKTIKYSKGSEDLNNKIKNLDEDLKKTGVISNSDDVKVQYLKETKDQVIAEVKLQEEELYSWREVSENHTEEEIEEFVEEIREKHRKLSLVENSIDKF
jgi:predicted HAD superfamily phosphohydrolase YqeG